MTPSQIEMVKDSFHRMYPVKNAIAYSYYEELFQIAPSVRAHFPKDMAAQSFKLADTVGVMVQHLHEVYVLEKTIAKLARRHVAYGIKSEHFAPIAVAFINALQTHLPTEVTPEETDAWLTFYALITDMMVEEMTTLLRAA